MAEEEDNTYFTASVPPTDDLDEAMLAEYGIGVPQIPQYIQIPAVEIIGRRPDAVRLQLEVESLPTRISRNEEGFATVHVAAARDVETMRGLLQSCLPIETVELLNQKTEHEGWTSLHISTIQNNVDVVEYILQKISDDTTRSEFIRQVDHLGWTSLHWSAALDHTEALELTMASMSIDDQRDSLTASTNGSSTWTLLHATAYGNAVNTMKLLTDKFDHEDTKWKILTCPTEVGKTPLHIAVAEGNVKAAIMLLDIAGEHRDELLNATDLNNSTPTVDASSQFPLLGSYLELATKFKGPVLHQAATMNDKFLVSWILSQDSDMNQLHVKNEDGLTVLQAASEANSADVITEIHQKLGQRAFTKLVTELSGTGETCFHICVKENNAAALLALLKGRRSLTELTNSSGETVEEMASKLDRQKLIKILQGFKMVVSGNMKKFFKEFVQHSLFALNLPELQIKRRYERIENRKEKDLGIKRNINYDAAICLLYEHGDKVRINRLIKAAKMVDPDNIHTWCNRGVFLIEDEAERSDIEWAALKVMELLVEPSGIPELRAKVDFAYWHSEGHRTETAREKSYAIFEECYQKASLHSDKTMREYCSYFYLKFLVRYIRYETGPGQSIQWFEKMLARAVDLMLILYASDLEEYRCFTWLWLAEIQLTRIPQEALDKSVAVFQEKALEDDCTPETCLNKTIESDAVLTLDKKLEARVAKNCLQMAYRCTNNTAMVYWYEKALELSEQWIQQNYWLFMCASTSAQALIKLWAEKFYVANEKLVKDCYDNYCKATAGAKHTFYVDYVANSFYSRDFCNDHLTRKYLIQAKDHLLKLMEHDGGKQSHGIAFARVKCLLGEPHHEILEAFSQAEKYSDEGFRRAKVYENRGYYHGVMREIASAQMYFRLALEKSDPVSSRKLHMARMGLEIIKRGQGDLNHPAIRF